MLPHVSIFTHTFFFSVIFFWSLGPRESFPSETGVTDRKDNNWRMKIFSGRFDFRPGLCLPSARLPRVASPLPATMKSYGSNKTFALHCSPPASCPLALYIPALTDTVYTCCFVDSRAAAVKLLGATTAAAAAALHCDAFMTARCQVPACNTSHVYKILLYRYYC